MPIARPLHDDDRRISGGRGWNAVLRALIATLLSTLMIAGHGAVRLTQAPAELRDGGSLVLARADVEALRFERIEIRRFDPAGDPFDVRPAHLASPDSLTAAPSLGARLPDPRDAHGNPIAISGPVPLSPAVGHQFAGQEAIFIVAMSPLLPSDRFGTAPDGRRFVAVTVDVSDGTHHTLALTETSPGSERYVGYLQPNTIGSPITMPPGGTITLRYDDYGDVADSATSSAPWNVSPTFLAGIQSERATSVSGVALPTSELFLTKRALRASAMTGDFIAYDLRLENTGSLTRAAARITDTLPPGFRYQPGSLRVNGTAAPDPAIDGSARVLDIPLGDLAAGDAVTVRYVTEVTVAAPAGMATNRALATAGGLQSNLASIEILVEKPLFNDRAFLIGRVIAGDCGDHDAPGVPGVRLYMEDGTNVVTDAHGRWHIEGVSPGTHVLQLDTITLGPRHSLRRCQDNTRQAGNPVSRFVNVQGGTLWRENWYLEERPALAGNLQQQLTTTLRDGRAVLTLRLGNGDTAFDEVTTRFTLPDSLSPVPGSATLDGAPIPDPLTMGPHESDNGSDSNGSGSKSFTVSFQPHGHYWEHTLSLALALNPDEVASVEHDIVAETVGTAPDRTQHTVASRNSVSVAAAQAGAREILLQSRFGSMSSELSAPFRSQLRATADPLRETPGVMLEAIGHSDDQPVVSRTGRIINDNYALSEARARAVADYVDDLLALPGENITVIGKGPDEPIADNSTPEGRALNRRVTARFRVPEKRTDAQLTVTRPDSGLNRDQAAQDDAAAATQKLPGFLSLADDTVTPYPVINVSARLDSRLKPRLLVDGERVPDARIGMKLADAETGTTVYSWVGIELPHIGDHRFALEGVDGFGNARFRDEALVRRSGRIKSIEQVAPLENSADGLTPVGVRLRILDEFNQPIRAQTELTLISGALRPFNPHTRDSLTERPDTVVVDRDGIVRFEPVSTAGTYRIRLTDGNVISEEIEVPVSPEMRDWILVGFGEGTVGYNTLRGNMHELHDAEDHLFTDGEAAFFARGTVRGEWLLTAAFDSRRDARREQPLGQSIDPQRWYTLYGDDTHRAHDAPSAEKLYVRLEKRDFYALFGDYDTGLTVTELGHYQRVLTGAKSEWVGRHVTAMGFAAESAQGFVRDDIAPDGTSGLYRTSRAPIIPGSEVVTLEVRDRFTNEVLRSTPMTRFIDYGFDPADGTLYFRQPVMMQDPSFNPQRIVVRYEVESGLENTVAGGRVTVADSERTLVAGLIGVYDGTTGTDGRLAAADITWTPNEHHVVKAELAGTMAHLPGDEQRDRAWLVEHRYDSERLDTRVRAEQTDAGFGLGQLAADDDDRRLMQAGARYRFSETTSIAGDLTRLELLRNDNRRDVAEGRLEYELEDWQAYGGVRVANDQSALSEFSSRQLIAGGRRNLFDRRVVLHASGETSVDATRENIDYPNRLTVGADYQLNEKAALFANQEFSWGHERRTQDSRIGARATPWAGATVTSEISRTLDEYGPRLMAHAGLFQSIELSRHWRADLGFDRAQTLTDDPDDVPEPFDPRLPPASGTFADDYTAVAAGIGYRDASWQWTNRVEMRWSDTDDKWNVLSGLQHRLNDVDTLAARLLHFDQQFHSGDVLRSSELEGSWVRRPLDDGLVWLNRTRLVYDELRDALGSRFGHRVVNNTHLNMTWWERHQLSLQYGARYVGETIDDTRFEGYTDLLGGEYRYDITRRWDIGLRGSTIASYNSGVRENAFGVMVGFSPIRDIWLSLGYNFRGFYDSDFSGAAARIEGIVLDFRIKFDQRSVRRHLAANEDGGARP